MWSSRLSRSKFEDRWKDRIANNLLNCLSRHSSSDDLDAVFTICEHAAAFQGAVWMVYTKDCLCTEALPLDAWCPLGGRLICTVVACVGLFLQHSATGTTTEGKQNNPMLEKLSSKQFRADFGAHDVFNEMALLSQCFKRSSASVVCTESTFISSQCQVKIVKS